MLVDFYHLTASPLEKVLPRLCERLLEEGQRLLVLARPDQIEGIDRQLWDYARAAFLPHGTGGGPDAERQPILVAPEGPAVNAARNVALADGRWREDALDYERIFYLFDETGLEDARRCWSALKERSDVERRYWKQGERGKWVQGP